MKHKRSRKEMRQDSKEHYGGLAEHKPAEKAKTHMDHKPYAAILIRQQGEQIRGDADDSS